MFICVTKWKKKREPHERVEHRGECCCVSRGRKAAIHRACNTVLPLVWQWCCPKFKEQRHFGCVCVCDCVCVCVSFYTISLWASFWVWPVPREGFQFLPLPLYFECPLVPQNITKRLNSPPCCWQPSSVVRRRLRKQTRRDISWRLQPWWFLLLCYCASPGIITVLFIQCKSSNKKRALPHYLRLAVIYRQMFAKRCFSPASLQRY